MKKSGCNASVGTLVDEVEERLLGYLRESGLGPGDSLPAEEELAWQMSVSRQVVREGLSRLKALGIVESRKKRGMVLRRPSAFASFRKLAGTRLFSAEDCAEFMELRVALELGMCSYIHARKSPEQLSALRKVAEREVCDVDAELDFHDLLMQCGGNSMVREFRSVLVNAFRRTSGRRVGGGRKTPGHLEICEVLEHGTVLEFTDVMRRHFAPYLEHIRP